MRATHAGGLREARDGHACNLEEPVLFKLLLERFLHQVDPGQYRMRDSTVSPGRML